eukprot:scaffold25565_cov63-Phaeocystis_antarctica.AAC.3
MPKAGLLSLRPAGSPEPDHASGCPRLRSASANSAAWAALAGQTGIVFDMRADPPGAHAYPLARRAVECAVEAARAAADGGGVDVEHECGGPPEPGRGERRAAGLMVEPLSQTPLHRAVPDVAAVQHLSAHKPTAATRLSGAVGRPRRPRILRQEVAHGRIPRGGVGDCGQAPERRRCHSAPPMRHGLFCRPGSSRSGLTGTSIGRMGCCERGHFDHAGKRPAVARVERHVVVREVDAAPILGGVVLGEEAKGAARLGPVGAASRLLEAGVHRCGRNLGSCMRQHGIAAQAAQAQADGELGGAR